MTRSHGSLRPRSRNRGLSWRWVHPDRCVSLCGRYAVCKVHGYWPRAELWRVDLMPARRVGECVTAPDAMRLAQVRLRA